MKKKLLAFTAAMVMTFTTMTAMAQSNMKVDITNAADKMVALKTDGTVKTMNYDVFNYSVLNSVENVKSIASEDYIGNTFFLLSNDGTVQAISKFSKSTFTGVEGWTGIQAIDAANDVVFGLTSEGTVKIAGSNASYFKAALDWKNIKSIFAKEDTLIGIDGEGKVYVASIMTDGKEISGWANMKKVVYDINSFWGITNDGQLVTTNSQFKVSTMKSGADLLGDFEDIDCMSGYATSGYYARILALKKDGRLIDITNYAEYTSKLATYSATVLSENVESFVTGATHYALVLKDGEVLSDKMSVPTTPDWILGIDIRYNGKYVDCDAAPYIKNDRTMVPVRAIAEAMGATVNYDDATKTATIIKGGSKIEIKMYSSVAYVNGVAYTLDAPAETVNDRIFVPVRFISEGFGCNVNWDANTKSVIIK